MNTNLLIHVDADDASVIKLALNNISNYFAGLDTVPQVVLVANGPAVRQFIKDCPHAETIARLHKAGVSFRLCRNAVNAFGLAAENLHPSCEIIPAGMVELVKLQNEGFAYVKP